MLRRDGGNPGTRRVFTWALLSSIILLVAVFAPTTSSFGAAEQGPKAPGDHLLYYPFVPRNLAPPHPLAGLTYAIQYKGLWTIDWTGQAHFLIDIASARLSPDGRFLVYSDDLTEVEQSDIWLKNLQNGSLKNLTNTPDRNELLPEWIPNRPGLILFGSEKAEILGVVRGKPTIVHSDGSGYQVLDENGLLNYDAIRADGSQIAYNAFDFTRGGIYTFGKGVEYLDPMDYSQPADRLWQPAWSADGQRIAWGISFTKGDPYPNMGAMIFDPKNQLTGTFIYPNGGMEPTTVTWSPDQEWLTFARRYSTAEPWGIWAYHDRNHTWARIGAYQVARSYETGAVWRYDGKYLAYDGLEGVIVVEAGTWKEVATLPAGSTPVDWFYPAR